MSARTRWAAVLLCGLPLLGLAPPPTEAGPWKSTRDYLKHLRKKFGKTAIEVPKAKAVVHEVEEAKTPAAPAKADACKPAFVGSAICAGCHSDISRGFAYTIHGRLSDSEIIGDRKGCEACHGPCGKHVQGVKTAVDSFRLGKAPGNNASVRSNKARDRAKRAEEVCLRCHKGGQHFDWKGSAHQMEGMSCVDCHKIHDNRQSKNLLVKSDPKLCYDCHQEKLGQSNLPSHHPIREGKMNCSSCHAVHGSMVGLLKTDERPSDVCFKCHTDKQGPFTFEHDAVSEGCHVCHQPHGTVANNLLKQNEPFICLSCHQMHFHMGRTAATGTWDFSAAGGGNDAYNAQVHVSQGVDGFRMSFGTKCTQCHPMIHGTDLPSQSSKYSGTSGGYFTR